MARILTLAKITRTEQLLKTNDLRALACGQIDSLDGFRQIGLRTLAGTHLDESQLYLAPTPRHGKTFFSLSLTNCKIKKEREDK
jgi:hypothetical protein